MPDAHDASFGKTKRTLGIRRLSKNPCWGAPLTASKKMTCDQCRIDCYMKNLENAARKSVQLYNLLIDAAWEDIIKKDNTITWNDWEPEIIQPCLLLEKVIYVVDEIAGGDFDPIRDCEHADGHYLNEDAVVDDIMETLGEYELINPNDLGALFKANTPEPHMPGISTSAPLGMKMKYANIKKHHIGRFPVGALCRVHGGCTSGLSRYTANAEDYMCAVAAQPIRRNCLRSTAWSNCLLDLP